METHLPDYSLFHFVAFIFYIYLLSVYHVDVRGTRVPLQVCGGVISPFPPYGTQEANSGC